MICCPIKNRIGLDYDGNEGVAQIKFAPSGNFVLINTWFKSKTELFDFDNSSGDMKLKVSIPVSYPISSEFAPNENIFYVIENFSIVNQFSIDNKNNYKMNVIKVMNSELYNMQLGSDKKIYVVQIGNYLRAITNPNGIGSNCGYNDTFLKLSEPKNTPGLPNFNQSYFYTPSIDYAYEQDCRTNTIAFEGKDTFKSTSQSWMFKKGNTLDTKTGKDVSYTFADTGKWQVSYIANNGSRKDTVTKTITIRPRLEQGFLGKDVRYCDSSAFPLKLNAPKNLHCIHWYNDTKSELSRTDTVKISKEGTYYAKATNLSFCVEWDTIKLVKAKPKADFMTTDVCEKDSVEFINTSDERGYIWKFGDGQTSSMENPKHLYNIGGVTRTFNVTLMALGLGCSDSTTKQVTINASPDSKFTYQKLGKTVDLKADKSGLTSYKWRFGTTDSITKSIPTHTHTITSIDQNNICLTVTDLSGCQSETCNETVGIYSIIKARNIFIFPNPNQGSFTLSIEKPENNFSIEIYNLIGEKIITIVTSPYKLNYLIELNVTSGIYLVRVVNGFSTFHQKVSVSN